MSDTSNPSEVARLDPNFAMAAIRKELTWLDAASLPALGRAWPSESDAWTRLPSRAESLVRPEVWALSRCSSGLYLEFETDAPELAARWSVGQSKLELDHMPATGASGLDLYEWDQSRWRWAATGRPGLVAGTSFECTFFENRDQASRRFRLYLPLYNSVVQLNLGTPAGSDIGPCETTEKPICIYGTSIVQGASASRPGMAYPSILGRRLKTPVVNLGFSGNAHAEQEIAMLLAELRPEVLVIDCLPNIKSEGSENVLTAFLETLAQNNPETALLFIDYPNCPKEFASSAFSREREQVRHAAKAAFDATRGDLHWRWLPGDDLLGNDGEATVDGVHPTDLGFQRIAAGIGEAIEELRKAR